MKMAKLRKALGQRIGRAWAQAQHHVSWTQSPGLALICIQAASLAAEAGLACHSDESGKSSRLRTSMNKKHFARLEWGQGGLGRISQRFHVMHLPVHCLHLGNNNLKANKEVHIIIGTRGKLLQLLLEMRKCG